MKHKCVYSDLGHNIRQMQCGWGCTALLCLLIVLLCCAPLRNKLPSLRTHSLAHTHTPWLEGYAVFASITLGVLLLMDVLECFLHALRLHW